MSDNKLFVKPGDSDFIAIASKALNSYQLVVPYSTKGSRTTYSDIETNISVRDQYSRGHYDYFRPDERIPTKPLDIIRVCRLAYDRVGIIRNIIDIMGDFGCQGIKLIHPNKTIQKFYRGWFKKVRGKHVSERFLNLFYRDGNVIIKRSTGRINIKQKKLFRTYGKIQPDSKLDSDLTITKRTIPIRYNFLNPLSLKIVGEEISQFVGKTIYALKISSSLKSAISSPNEYTKQLVDLLPSDLVSAIKSGKSVIPLNPESLIVKHYKKDDWQPWARPMIYAILSELLLLEKMQLADLAALDGAISQVRLWKLGDLDKEIFPTETAVNKLADVLISNPGGGSFDLIWGPELSVEDYNTNVHQFLGDSKYRPTMDRIYAGLGVPPTLTGAAEVGSGFTNNYVSLKTLIQRLEYGRSVLTEFWEQEIELVRQAMGFRLGAKVEFDNMILSDEAAEKALLIQLVDRDIISLETVLERFGEIPEFEEIKLRKEEERRKKGKMKNKAGPWHNPEKMFDFMKIALQRGFVSPEQLGMTKEFPTEFLDVETPYDKQLKRLSMKQDVTTKQKGEPQQGRPRGSKDTVKRKPKTVKPIGASIQEFFNLFNWAYEVQGKIYDIIQPVILKHYGKSTTRELSLEQHKHADDVRFTVLCNLLPYEIPSAKSIYNIVVQKKPKDKYMVQLVNALYNKYTSKYNVKPTVNVVRMLRAYAYAALNCEGD